MSGDPLDGDITDPQTLNRYAYVRNNPVNMFDPTGMDACYWDEGDQSDPEDDLNTRGACETAGGNWIPTLNQQITVTADEPDSFDTLDSAISGDLLDFANASASRPQSQLNLSQKGQVCEAKVQSAVNTALNTSTLFLGPQMGGHHDDPSDPGLINGAYNFNYFAPGVQFGAGGSHAVPGANCGRFSGSGLHIPVNGGGCNLSGDPNSPFGFNAQQNGSYFTAHIDSANPYDDLLGFFSHLINNVILRRPHGC